MDDREFAQLLGSYGEFVAAIAVVATLVYRAVQIRQNTESHRLGTELGLSSKITDGGSSVCQSPERPLTSAPCLQAGS